MQTTIKLEYNDIVRRVQIDLTKGFSNLKTQISNLLDIPVTKFVLKYLDDEKDLITIGESDIEFQEFLSNTQSRGSIRLIVNLIDVPSTSVPIVIRSSVNGDNKNDDVKSINKNKNIVDDHIKNEQEEEDLKDMYEDDTKNKEEKGQEEEKQQPPFIQIAKLLSNDKIVQDIQDAISSQVVTDSVVHLAEAYLDESDAFALPKSIFSEIPLLQGVLNELLTKNPELNDALPKITNDIIKGFVESHFFGAQQQHRPNFGMATFPFGCSSSSRYYGCNSRNNNNNNNNDVKTIHSNIYCDGCSNHHDLFVAAHNEGTVSPSAQICGIRYKSSTVEDFDLCETCEATGYFQNSHGPFLKIVSPNQAPTQIFCVINPEQRHGHPHHHRHHHHRGGCHPRPSCHGAGMKRGIFCSNDRKPEFHCGNKSSPQQQQDQQHDIGEVIAKGLEIFSSLMKNEDEIEKKFSIPTTANGVAVPTNTDSLSSSIKTTESVNATTAKTKNESEELKNENEIPEKWKNQIQLLQSVGFVEWKRYLNILEQENGNLERVIARIVSLNA